jgi:hypothetical protein
MIRKFGIQVHAGRRTNRPVGIVRRDRDVVRVGHRCDLFHRGNPAGAGHVGLKNTRGLFDQNLAEIEMRLKPLPGGDRDVGRVLQRRHRVAVFRRHRFFQKERVEGLEHLDDPAGRCDIEFPVRLYADIELRPPFAYAPDHLPHFVQGGRGQLPIGTGISAEGIVLPGGESHRDELAGRSRVGVGGPRDVAPTIAGIESQARVYLPAQQLVYRGAQLLADDIPEGNVDCADGRVERAAERILFDDIHPAPETLNVPGALAGQQLVKRADLSHHRRQVGRRCSFAPTVDPVLSLDANAHDVRARADAQDVRVDAPDLQPRRLGPGAGIEPRQRKGRQPLTGCAKELSTIKSHFVDFASSFLWWLVSFRRGSFVSPFALLWQSRPVWGPGGNEPQ